MKLTNSENGLNLEMKYTDSVMQVYVLPPGIYETLDDNGSLPSSITIFTVDESMRSISIIESKPAVATFVVKTFSYPHIFWFHKLEM